MYKTVRQFVFWSDHRAYCLYGYAGGRLLLVVLCRIVSVFKGPVQRVETFTVLGHEGGTDEDPVPSETLPQANVTKFWEDYPHYCDLESALPRYRREVPSPQTNASSALAPSPDNDVNVHGNSSWDPVKFIVAEEPLEDTVLKKKCTEFQETWRRADPVPSYSIIDVVDFGLGCISDPVDSFILFNDAIRHTAEVSALKVKYDCLAVAVEQRNFWVRYFVKPEAPRPLSVVMKLSVTELRSILL